MSLKFQVGDRVEMVKQENNAKKGMKGTIVYISDFYYCPYGIKFDKEFGGHTLNGRCEDGYGYRVKEDLIKKIQEDGMKNVWEVIVVDKSKDEIVVREIVIDGDEKSACSKVSIKFSTKLKDLVFDNLHYITKNLGSYEEKK